MEGPPREFGTLKSWSENGEGGKRHKEDRRIY